MKVSTLKGNPAFIKPGAKASGAFNTNPPNLNKYQVIDHSVAVVPRQFGYADNSAMRSSIGNYSISIAGDSTPYVIRDVIDDFRTRRGLGMNINQFQDYLINR